MAVVGGPQYGEEAELLASYRGRWVAQDGLEVIFAGDSAEAVLDWLRRHGKSARAWRVPSSPAEAGSALSTA